MGLYLFRQFLRRRLNHGDWGEDTSRSSVESHPREKLGGCADLAFWVGAPNPNLSLNLGIVKPHPAVFYGVAAFGFYVQVGILAMTGLTTWKLLWTRDDDEDKTLELDQDPLAASFRSIVSERPEALIFICGSFFTCLGMFFCAALIGHSTREFRYRR